MRKNLIYSVLVIMAMLPAVSWAAPDYTPKYQLINNPDYPTNDLAVATYNLMDYGVDNTGKTDCTSTINTLLKKLNGVTGLGSIGSHRYITGGILYIPAGRYLVTGQIQLPRGVTIRGDWKKPDGKSPLKGTILVIKPNKSSTGVTDESKAAIVMQPTSELSNLTFWYPDQNVNNVTAYPPTVRYGYDGYWGNDYCNVRHCTFVNSYIGIKFSENNGGGCPNIFEMYGTPLCEGVVMDNIADVGRFDWLSFSPKYWANSGLDGAPSESAIRAYTRANATGFVMRRNDWSYTCNFDVDGYNVGFHAQQSAVEGRPNGHNYGFNFNDCATGILISESSGSGIMFTRVKTTKCDIGIHSRGGIGPVQFLGCDIQGGQAIYTEVSAGVGLMFQECNMSGAVNVMGAQFTSINCNYNSEVTIGPTARSIFTGNTFTGNGKFTNRSIYKCEYSAARVPAKALPEYKTEWMEIKTTRPARAALYVVTDAEFGAKGVDIETDLASQPDNSVAIQKALDKAGREGGGIVYIPAGHYRMDKGLRIPKGVELKGAGDIASVPKGNGAILEVWGVNEGNENAEAFIMMEEGSGIRGVHFNYPNQKIITDIKKYPYTIRGNKDCYVVNVAARTAYRVLDLFTNKCDNHYVDYLAGHAYMNVIRVGGGSQNGIISNIQCNTIAYACGDETKFGSWPNSESCKDKDISAKVYGQNYEHLDFFIIGDCRDQVLYNNFLFGCHDGMRFQKDNGKGAVNVHSLGNAVDGAVNTVVVNGLGSDLDLINSQIVALNHDKAADILDYSLEAYFFTTSAEMDKTVNLFSSNLWGGGNYMCNIQGGTCNIYLTNMAASGAKYTFNVAGNANMNVVGGYIQKVNKITNNSTSTTRTKVYSTVFDQTGRNGAWATDENNLPIAWSMTTEGLSNTLPRTGWIVTSNKNNGNANRTIDGNASTRWDTSAAQSSSTDTWLNLNMGKDVTFNSIILDAANSPNDGPGAYKVEVYSGGSWKEVATGENGSAMTVITFDQVTASQVRITLGTTTKGNYWSVHELYLANLDMSTGIDDIETEAAGDITAVKVYTVGGMKVADVAAGELREALQTLDKGIYIIRCMSGNRVVKTTKTVVGM